MQRFTLFLDYKHINCLWNGSLILRRKQMAPDSKVHGTTWDPSGAGRTRVGPVLDFAIWGNKYGKCELCQRYFDARHINRTDFNMTFYWWVCCEDRHEQPLWRLQVRHGHYSLLGAPRLSRGCQPWCTMKENLHYKFTTSLIINRFLWLQFFIIITFLW